jgi:hypothetical protein
MKMYCSSCGGAVTRDLSYCNHCGARLTKTNEREPARLTPLAIENLVWAMVAVFVVGLGGTIGLMAVMKDVFGSSNPGLIIAFTLLVITLTIAVEGVLIWTLLRRQNVTREHTDPERLKKTATKELNTPQPLTLPEPLPSVTEHTTRAFEPVFNKGQSD